MNGLVVFGGGAVFIFSVLGLFGLLHSRKLLREAKNYERGLKIVPMHIHLPPISEDTDVNGRDTRDLIDENISKATVLYNVLASTAKKHGLKTKFYGQRHISFEIVASRSVVQYYAAVPIVLVPLVQQAIVSAYPTARLEEVPEHNIFNKVGKISGTMGGELVLKEDSAYPIATFQELKRDAMQSILNALSTLEKEDGAAIQILLRPANDGWRQKANKVAASKRKGEGHKKAGDSALWWVKQLSTAAWKAPDDQSKSKEDKQISGLDQSIVESMEEKTRHPGYEVLIRVIASSNISQRSRAIIGNIQASFALFDAPNKNGFKFAPAKDIEHFVTSYIMRFFPQENNKNVLNSVELATIFHFPDQRSIPTSQLERQSSKQVDGPRNVPDEGLLLGYNVFRGSKKKIVLSANDRRRHMYIVGQTGTGKSILLENLALQDMLAGNGFAFIDPHGDTAEALLQMVPKERTEDVIYFCPADMDYPLGLNLFEYDSPDQKDFLIQEAINMLYKLYDPQRQGIIGPRYEYLFRNAALTVMAGPDGGSFVDIPKLFNDKAYVEEKLKYVDDQIVLDFWRKEMPASERSNEFGEVKGWFVSKFGAFLSNVMMRNIIGQTKSAYNLREIMDNKRILLVNLSKGRTGELNSKLLGMIFVMKFQAAAMSRANVPEDDRVDFSLYVDEFQNFSTDSFATILSEARKYHLNLIVANQFTTQLADEIRDAVFGNVGSIIALRVGTNDAEFLVKRFAPIFDIDDLIRLPNYNAITQIIIGGVPTQPFSMATLPPLGKPNPKLGDALKQLSYAKYGKPKAVVEAEVYKRLSSPPTPEKPKAGGGSVATNQPPRPSSGSSFLDDWMTKRQNPANPTMNKPFSAPPPPASAQALMSKPVSSRPDAPLLAPANNVASPSALQPAGSVKPAALDDLLPHDTPVSLKQ